MFLGTKRHKRCESQWFLNIGNFHLTRVKRPQGKSCPLAGYVSESEALTVTSSGRGSVMLPWGEWGELGRALQQMFDGRRMGNAFKIQIFRISHLEGMNGSGSGSSARPPSFTHYPCALKHSQAEVREILAFLCTPRQPGHWTGSPTGRGLD